MPIEDAAAELGVDIRREFYLGGEVIKIDGVVFIPDFGSRKGTILASEYWKIEAILQAVQNEGYGFSCFDFLSEIDSAGLIVVLSDWGWAGPLSEKPKWLIEE